MSGAVLPPVTLIAGGEPLLLLEAADAWRAKARAAGFAERLVFEVEAKARRGEADEESGGACDWSEVRHALSMRGLFASRKWLEFRLPALRLDAEGMRLIEDFLRQPDPDVRLLLLAPEYAKKSATLALVKKIAEAGQVQPVWRVRPEDLPRWLTQRANRLGLALTQPAAQVLAERVEGNLLAGDQELRLLALLLPGQSVGPEALARIGEEFARYDVFRLVEAALAGQAGAIPRMLRSLRGEGTHPAALWPWLHGQLQLLAELAEGQAERVSEAVLARLGIFEPRASAFRSALKRAPAGYWQRRLHESARLDRLLKGYGIADPWLELERLLLRVALPPARAGAFAAMAEAF